MLSCFDVDLSLKVACVCEDVCVCVKLCVCVCVHLTIYPTQKKHYKAVTVENIVV